MALHQRTENADRAMQAGAGVAQRDPGLERTTVFFLAGDRDGSARCLGDHVEGRMTPFRAVQIEPLDAGVHDPRIDVNHFFVAEAQPFDCAGREVLDEDIRMPGISPRTSSRPSGDFRSAVTLRLFAFRTRK